MKKLRPRMSRARSSFRNKNRGEPPKAGTTLPVPVAEFPLEKIREDRMTAVRWHNATRRSIISELRFNAVCAGFTWSFAVGLVALGATPIGMGALGLLSVFSRSSLEAAEKRLARSRKFTLREIARGIRNQYRDLCESQYYSLCEAFAEKAEENVRSGLLLDEQSLAVLAACPLVALMGASTPLAITVQQARRAIAYVRAFDVRVSDDQERHVAGLRPLTFADLALDPENPAHAEFLLLKLRESAFSLEEDRFSPGEDFSRALVPIDSGLSENEKKKDGLGKKSLKFLWDCVAGGPMLVWKAFTLKKDDDSLPLPPIPETVRIEGPQPIDGFMDMIRRYENSTGKRLDLPALYRLS